MTVLIRLKCILVFLSGMLLFSSATSHIPVTKEKENSRIDRIEELLTNQNERIRTLENIVISQKNEIQNLRDEVSDLKNKDRVHEQKLLRLVDILAKSTPKMADVVNSASTNDSKLPKIPKKDITFEKGKRLLGGNIVPTPVSTLKPVTAFYAYLSKHEDNPGTHQTLIFDTVITNENNGYHPFTGIFIAPEKGTYVFTFSLRLSCHSYGPYQIVKNAEAVGAVYSDLREVCIQDHITGTIVINANQGDEIYVRTYPSVQHIGSIYSDGGGRSSFAGWLISK